MVGQEPQEAEGSVLLVLRQSREGGPWLPLTDQESVTVDAQGNATVQLRSFSDLTTMLFKGPKAAMNAARTAGKE